MDDLISRQAAIDALLHNQEVYSNNFGTDAIDKYTVAIIANDVQTIVQLPSAQRTGRWIFGHTLGHSWMKCSECLVSQDGQTACFSYCPNCGARMEEQE